MGIYNKLQACRSSIKASDLKKAGHNDFSNYDYYTPEQVNKLVNEVCTENKLFNKFDLIRNELGIFGQLTIIDLENPEDTAIFLMAADIPSITATNICQQLGGAMTFTYRYLLQDAYDIVDNNLDFDAQKPDNKNKGNNSGSKRKVESWLCESEFKKILSLESAHRIKKGIEFWTSEDRGMKKDYKQQLNNRINELNKGA
jgi:hypothetical protein